MAKKSSSRFNWKTILNIVTIAALLLLIYGLRDQIRQTYENLDNINFWLLLLMPVWQVVNYFSYVKMYEHLFEFLGDKVTKKRLLKAQLELNFINTVFPSGGVSGISYFSVRMSRYGVSSAKATLIQGLKYVLVFMSFQIMLIAGLLLLSLSGQASNFLILVASSLATLLFVGTLLMSYVLNSKQRMNSFFTALTRGLNRVIHVVRRSHPETIKLEKVQLHFDEIHENYLLIKRNKKVLKKPLLYALLANTAEVMTIYTVYAAFGEFVNPGAIIIAYAVANFAGLISVLPGGVGIYEALMTAILAAAGIPAALSLPVTIMYRILNMIIQLPPGYYFYNKTLSQKARTSV